MNNVTRRAAAPLLAAGALFIVPVAANAASVEPVWHDDNPSCLSLGYSHEIKFEPPASGSESADGVTVDMTVGAGELVGWTASAPIDAVIVKGGSNANIYTYPGESTGDTGLRTPLNGDKYYGLSHVSFCWDDQHPEQPPVDQPPTPQPQPQPEPQPQPDGGVLPEAHKSGASKLSGPSGCAGRTVKATVKGAEIATVVFTLDGRRVKTVAGPGSYSVKTSKLGIGVHRIKAKVTYTAASATPARTHVVTFQRCAVKKIAPRFAG